MNPYGDPYYPHTPQQQMPGPAPPPPSEQPPLADTHHGMKQKSNGEASQEPAPTTASERIRTPASAVQESPRVKRVFVACSRCRKQKIKCSGTQPCVQCNKCKQDCTFDTPETRIVVRKEYLAELKRAASQKAAMLKAFEKKYGVLTSDDIEQYMSPKDFAKYKSPDQANHEGPSSAPVENESHDQSGSDEDAEYEIDEDSYPDDFS